MKKKLVLMLIAVMLFTGIPTASAAGEYSDVPADSWATAVIASATEYGLVSGIGGGQFGYGREISRAEFVTLACRMIGWTLFEPDLPSFDDVSPKAWYYKYIETALLYGALDIGDSFSPDAPITREDMAIILVRALGYNNIASDPTNYDIPFTDVTANKGYITVAYDIGMINGTSPSTFAPKNTAKREEAAAMLVRVYEKYNAKTDFLHGFYAFSSYSQRYVTASMDAVSFGWSAMCCEPERGVWLNTGISNGNQWAVPESYENITAYLDENGTAANLSVYMDTKQTFEAPDGTAVRCLRELLFSGDNRKAAVAAIMDELTREYDAIGKSPYSGVTIDFEGLKGEEEREAFTAFLTLLSSELKPRGLKLYVAVQPALADGVYFNGYDYRAIGELADKVILMAHNYNTTSLEGFVGTQWHWTTAITPISSVYYSLRAITDKDIGVQDKSKLVLAISFSSIAWEITEDDKVKSATPYTPAMSTVYQRLLQEDTIANWSEMYKNPYMIYYNENGQKFFLWYENAQSVDEKIKLARLFGITGVSVWRIGIIPDYDEVFDVWAQLGDNHAIT